VAKLGMLRKELQWSGYAHPWLYQWIAISIVTRGGKGGMNSQLVTLIEQLLCKIAFDLKRCDLHSPRPPRGIMLLAMHTLFVHIL